MEKFDYRAAVLADADACVELRGKTRENAISASRLAELGITARTWGDSIATGKLLCRVCTVNDEIVAYCFGDRSSGEIVVLAVLPTYEGRGVGSTLLADVMDPLRTHGHKRLFVGCSRNPDHRSYGFYRHPGVDTHGVGGR